MATDNRIVPCVTSFQDMPRREKQTNVKIERGEYDEILQHWYICVHQKTLQPIAYDGQSETNGLCNFSQLIIRIETRFNRLETWNV